MTNIIVLGFYLCNGNGGKQFFIPPPSPLIVTDLGTWSKDSVQAARRAKAMVYVIAD